MPVLGAPSRRLEVLITARMAAWKLVYGVLLANVPVSEHNSKRGGVFVCGEPTTRLTGYGNLPKLLVQFFLG